MSRQSLDERITSLESLIKANQRVHTPIGDSVWLVYNPNDIQVWCSKVDCPHLGRETKVETVTQPLTEEDKKGMDEELLAAIGDSDEISLPVLRVSEPKKGKHTLGIVAAFSTEREATNYIKRYYHKIQNDDTIDRFELCVCEVAV